MIDISGARAGSRCARALDKRLVWSLVDAEGGAGV
jgi:hypothetical protein